jgi:hypothetical protein
VSPFVAGSIRADSGGRLSAMRQTVYRPSLFLDRMYALSIRDRVAKELVNLGLDAETSYKTRMHIVRAYQNHHLDEHLVRVIRLERPN